MRTHLHLMLLAAIALVPVGGCKKSKPSDCKAVGDHYMALLIDQLDKDNDPAAKSKAQAILPNLRDSMIKTCNDKKWSNKVRECMLAAKNDDDLGKCDVKAKEPSDQTKPTSKPTGNPKGPSGSN